MLPRGDAELVQIVTAALADATRRSGEWLVCRPGCHQCCVGVFAISSLDAERLREGYQQLARTDPAKAARVAGRVAEARRRLREGFPGDAVTGVLAEDEASQEIFEDFANDEPCPVLDPVTGTCDLYEARPMTCRVFGPPVRSEDGLGVCELCFQGASTAEIEAAEMLLPSPALEASLTEPLGEQRTIIAFALQAVFPSSGVAHLVAEMDGNG